MQFSFRNPAILGAAVVGAFLLGKELPSSYGQKTVVEIPNAVPQGVVVGQPNSVLRYQAVDTSTRGLVVLDTQTGQVWHMSGNQWVGLPELPGPRQ